ncbi:MAG: DegT/DnrJ/EryC1/StrS family aminotransferase [Proteobacteria bacterium]|nr:DegT/DnrJ/EryC1/StrS family aminotransferase [Pseudomonadota bacterium]
MNTLQKANAERISHLCFPTENSGDWSFDAFVNHRSVRYFSYGRHALYEALRVIGCAKGDSVLLPAFICRELLSAINTIGAVPVYYHVDKDLQLAELPDALPFAKTILAVNYFGFPQSLEPFQRYAARTEAVIIEDNAHGFLSRDEEGQALGTRGDIGIFSLRKTLMLPNGAAMVINAHDKSYTIKPQIVPSAAGISISFRVKRLIHKSQRFIDLRMIRFLTSIIRTARKITSGNRIAPSAPDAEFRLPGNAAPCIELQYFLDHLDAEQEISRRCELYRLLDSVMRRNGFEPVFASLPEHVVPYAYPFYTSGNQIDEVKEVLEKLDLECFSWPELPEDVIPTAPNWFKNIRIIGFSW